MFKINVTINGLVAFNETQVTFTSSNTPGPYCSLTKTAIKKFKIKTGISNKSQNAKNNGYCILKGIKLPFLLIADKTNWIDGVITITTSKSK